MLPFMALTCSGVVAQWVLPGTLLWMAWQPDGPGRGGAIAGAAALAWLLAYLPWAQAAPYWLLIAYPAIAFFEDWRFGGGWEGLVAAATLAGGWLGLRAYFNRGPRPAERLAIAAPFGPGVYFVSQGGGSVALNHHYRNASQRYALDILRLGWLGLRARGTFPSTLGAYHIFGTPVLAPHDGVVTAVVDGLPDLDPIVQRDRSHPAGNHVVIVCTGGDVLGADVYLGLAHLQGGSIAVTVGERVAAGQVIARVGNSGNTTEPHLHIHAKRGGSPASMLDGRGISLALRRRFLSRNDLIFVRPRRGPGALSTAGREKCAASAAAGSPEAGRVRRASR